MQRATLATLAMPRATVATLAMPRATLATLATPRATLSDNVGSAEGNPKNAGNRSTGQGKIKAGKRSGLRSTSSRSGVAAERENNPKDASCDYRVTVLGLAAGKLQHVMLGKVTPYAKGYAALV